MRLLNVRTLEIESFSDPNQSIPPYAIASHRWGREEATLKDVKKRRGSYLAGWYKVETFARYVRKNVHGVKWLWIDTCCVNRESSQEVNEAVNLSFRWYANAEVCLAWLEDVDDADDAEDVPQSGWFRRGWTLSELLAPRTVLFLSSSWEVIGRKGEAGRTRSGLQLTSGPGMESMIAQITGIPISVLYDFENSWSLTVEERLEWMEGRATTLEEDRAYSMLGIFGANMPVKYGEGAESARKRLLSEISKKRLFSSISANSTAASTAVEEDERGALARRKRPYSPIYDTSDQVPTTGTRRANPSVPGTIELAPYPEAAGSGRINNAILEVPSSQSSQPAPGTPASNGQQAKFNVLATFKSSLRFRACFVFIMLGFVVIGGSLAVGLYYSIARNRIGDGFTTAGWMTAVGTLVLAAPMAKHYPHCRCWTRNRVGLLP